MYKHNLQKKTKGKTYPLKITTFDVWAKASQQRAAVWRVSDCWADEWQWTTAADEDCFIRSASLLPMWRWIQSACRELSISTGSLSPCWRGKTSALLPAHQQQTQSYCLLYRVRPKIRNACNFFDFLGNRLESCCEIWGVQLSSA